MFDVVMAWSMFKASKVSRIGYSLYRFSRMHMSPWMLAILAACAVFPGPLDELVIGPVLAILVLRTRKNRVILRRYIKTAWRDHEVTSGGDSASTEE